MKPKRTLSEVLAEARANAEDFEIDEEEVIRLTREARQKRYKDEQK